MIRPPDEVVAALAKIDARDDTFDVNEVESVILRAIKKDAVPEEQRRGYWAELAAFSFDPHPAPSGGPWKTYFQPAMTFQSVDGTPICCPDLAEADQEVIEYWAARAKAVTHPILAARYADLVWDFKRRVTGRKPDIKFARLAVDSYVAAIKRDDGAAWGDNFYNLSRVLNLALSIRDAERTRQVVEATIDYADRTAEDRKIGTYCYLFDNLLPSEKGPKLTEVQERSIVKRFEEQFAEMTKPGSPWDTEPHAPREIGLRLARYYKRKRRGQDRTRVLNEIARSFERRADLGDALTGIIFLEDARKFFLEAGSREEAERIQRKSQDLAPAAEKGMVHQTFRLEIPDKSRTEFLNSLLEHGVEAGLHKLAGGFVLDQNRLKAELEERAKRYPIQALFPPMLIGKEGIKARVDDTSGDPAGPMVWETVRQAEVSSIWLSWGLDHLIENGLTPEQFVEFVAKTPVFTEDRLSLIKRGVRAHFFGDYVQSIHVLIPQIERAVVGLTYLLGGSSVKPHRSGRAVMQAKSLNDALEDEAITSVLGPDLTIYLIATLSHPKGMNIRNEVSHGLWPPAAFSKDASERVLHVLLALSLLRATKKDEDSPSEPDSKKAGE